MAKKTSRKNNNKKKKNRRIILSVLAVVLIAVTFVGGIIGYFYISNKINPALKNIYKELPLPIVKIENGSAITSQQLFQDTEAVKKFYESKNYAQRGERVDFSTKEGKVRLQMKEKNVLDKLVEDSIIQKIAKAKGIKISSQDMDNAVEKALITADSDYKKLAVNLSSDYGWTIDEFKEKIVKNQLYSEGLFQWYKDNLKNSEGYKRAESAKNSISEGGDNFDEVAGEFSDGESAKQDGRIPWVEEYIIVPEVGKVLFSMEDGQVSDVIISPLGMHIVMLEKRRETKGDDGAVKKEVQLKQIFIRGKSFIDWMQEQKKQMKVDVLLQEYQWNASTGEIEFSNSKLKEVVKKIKIKSQGDPSL
jgi:peptidyl-prolyl cis-trans isomerase SurA